MILLFTNKENKILCTRERYMRQGVKRGKEEKNE